MSASARAAAPQHIHLPSVHVRLGNGVGFDYEEDLYVLGRGRRRQVQRVVRLVLLQDDVPTLVRETRDKLCPKELAAFQECLPVLMEEGNPDATAAMEEAANQEFQRQLRIAAGEESACAKCGCSETRSCSGGCLWVTGTLCSRCV